MCYLSTFCLPNLLRVTNYDIAIICENKLKQRPLSYMSSIDTRYQSVWKTDRLNGFFNSTHDKGWNYIMYNSSLQFSVKEMADAKSDRIVGSEPKKLNQRIAGVELNSQNYR